jgi:hypothetical protein
VYVAGRAGNLGQAGGQVQFWEVNHLEGVIWFLFEMITLTPGKLSTLGG